LKSLLASVAVLLFLVGAVSAHEPGLEFLRKIPEFRDLSLKMTEEQLKVRIERHDLYSRRELQGERVSYWLVSAEGENVFVGFASAKCTGIQRMQPIPKQAMKDEIGAAEYNAWMGKLKAKPKSRTPVVRGDG
jgi:hypothetical protein